MSGSRKRVRFEQDLYISGDLTLSSANTYTEEEIEFGVNQPGQTTNKVIEITHVELEWPLLTTSDLALGTTEQLRHECNLHFGTETAMKSINDPYVIWHDEQVWTIFTPAATDFLVLNQVDTLRRTYSLLDKKGNGFMAANKVYFGANSAGKAAANVFRYRIHYRVVNAGLQSFLNLFQSQGSTN